MPGSTTACQFSLQLVEALQLNNTYCYFQPTLRFQTIGGESRAVEANVDHTLQFLLYPDHDGTQLR
jgi:hypothetical protein